MLKKWAELMVLVHQVAKAKIRLIVYVSYYNQIYNDQIAQNLVEMFADGSSITQVCATKLKITRRTFYEWMEKHPAFKEAAEAGYEASLSAQESIIDAASRGEIRNYSFPAHHLKLRTQFKKDYCEKADDNGTSGVQVLIKALAEAQAANNKRAAGDDA